MDGEDLFCSGIPAEYLELLLDLGIEYGFDPTSSIEMEDFMMSMLSEFSEQNGDLQEWMRSRLKGCFRCVKDSPVWIQNPDWQVESGRPMWFVGQVDIPAAQGVFHDDASFYIFWDNETGAIRCVMQVS